MDGWMRTSVHGRTLSKEPTPVRGVALVLGGQNPITLEYQIYPPPIDTLVTGMLRGVFNILVIKAFTARCITILCGHGF